MRILYGVVGEGMGHAMRSRVILEHLVRQGHDITIMTSGRAVDYLQQRFPHVARIHGYHMIYEDNRVRMGKTIGSNIVQGLAGLPQNIAAYFKLIANDRPEVVISDFESWTYLYGKAHGLPVFSIDNPQMIHRCAHAPALLAGFEQDFELAKAFVKGKLPGCDHYLITTFFYPEVRKPNTSLFPPILRPEILAAKPTSGEHLLVYQTAEGNDALAAALATTGMECRIYGMRRSITEEHVEGSLRYRPFSEATFIEDLASAKAVISGGGFTLMGEAVYLHKPMLSLPVGKQFEQILNAIYLEHLGYGMRARALDHDTLSQFMSHLPSFNERLSTYSQDGNALILQALDGHLDRVAAGVPS